MKSRDALIRLKRFEVDEKRQTVEDIEAMIADFRQMAADLDRQIAIEQERAGVTDVNHYAYPTFAKAAVERRDNLINSSRDLEEKLKQAQERLAEAEEELKRVGMLEERDRGRGEAAESDRSNLEHPGQHRVAS
ncbi:flagellar export protein FliJ [Methyloligella solikamskensis]|uniref:Flagellar export protein FliJ n=1 Tax=Methyloligella solikamskensis TaxID=1177756 RepID=A0ABW3J8F1_9HYPH